MLQKIERNGVLIDADLLNAQGAELGARMQQLEAQAYELAGQPFNLGSPKQIGELLFDKLKLPVARRTASGTPSTDEEVLAKLANDYPLPKVLLDHRALSKLKSTYTDKLPRMVNPRTGRVHTTYAQAVAVTGRLASNDPNLQNIPIRTAEGRRIREAFIAPRGRDDRVVRLLADRAADHGAHLRRRVADRGVRERRGRPSPHGGRDLRDDARRGDERAAPHTRRSSTSG